MSDLACKLIRVSCKCKTTQRCKRMQISCRDTKIGNTESGAALFVSLIMLILLTIIGLSSSQRSSLQERMAANYHLSNVAFNSAESAIGGFVREATVGNKLLSSHILSKLRLQGSVNDQCFDKNGSRTDCDGTVFMDSDRSSIITAEMDAQVVDDCNVIMCSGFSLSGTNAGSIGCRIFKVDGTGTVASRSVVNSFWAYEVSVCAN